jgi:hypothetical protein
MKAEVGLKWLLRFIGITTIPAFIAAVMPQSWLAHMVNKAAPGTSVGILITYLARVLMAVYFLAGIECFIFSADIKRYRPVIWVLAVGGLAITLVGLIALFAGVSPEHRVGFFWIVFGDFAEGLAQAILVVILLLRIPH